jgi:hypothetical protein
MYGLSEIGARFSAVPQESIDAVAFFRSFID